jgi:hypothetical protein
MTREGTARLARPLSRENLPRRRENAGRVEIRRRLARRICAASPGIVALRALLKVAARPQDVRKNPWLDCVSRGVLKIAKIHQGD